MQLADSEQQCTSLHRRIIDLESNLKEAVMGNKSLAQQRVNLEQVIAMTFIMAFCSLNFVSQKIADMEERNHQREDDADATIQHYKGMIRHLQNEVGQQDSITKHNLELIDKVRWRLSP